ncbi:hypothetical protein F5884DRAFT_747443 [Xylogone sp. PMI_703]|nr:hypothetical protein F5884DRAFT_747443 [Xylogone sp. PMI_703]
MFLEIIVTNAILINFILNFLFVAHPDTTSYTIYFIVSLLLESPFVLLYCWWKSGFSFQGWSWKWKCGRQSGARWKLPGSNNNNDEDINGGGSNARLLPLDNSDVDAAGEDIAVASSSFITAVESSGGAVPAVAAKHEDVTELEPDLETGLARPTALNSEVSVS